MKQRSTWFPKCTVLAACLAALLAPSRAPAGAMAEAANATSKAEAPEEPVAETGTSVERAPASLRTGADEGEAEVFAGPGYPSYRRADHFR